MSFIWDFSNKLSGKFIFNIGFLKKYINFLVYQITKLYVHFKGYYYIVVCKVFSIMLKLISCYYDYQLL
ncbi:Hypothetical protein ERGA_CDS_08620 [Ehrlichia ruminantium str. Gardel]|nr:Hypothetical protein ERGA_CDS_08620 [Ehrlichia ruminantium str. Gardel]